MGILQLKNETLDGIFGNKRFPRSALTHSPRVTMLNVGIKPHLRNRTICVNIGELWRDGMIWFYTMEKRVPASALGSYWILLSFFASSHIQHEKLRLRQADLANSCWSLLCHTNDHQPSEGNWSIWIYLFLSLFITYIYIYIYIYW